MPIEDWKKGTHTTITKPNFMFYSFLVHFFGVSVRGSTWNTQKKNKTYVFCIQQPKLTVRFSRKATKVWRHGIMLWSHCPADPRCHVSAWPSLEDTSLLWPWPRSMLFGCERYVCSNLILVAFHQIISFCLLRWQSDIEHLFQTKPVGGFKPFEQY